MPCECCGKSNWIVGDLRPKRTEIRKGTKFDYRTPLDKYVEYLVCNDCFHKSDSQFFKSLEQIEKQEALKDT